MIWRSIILLLLILPPAQPIQPEGQDLPEDLNESEIRSITKEQNPKSHVDATLKISRQRIDLAYQMIGAENFQAAALNLDTYSALIRYADDYTRQISGNKLKDRNACLKKIEQSIFKNTRTVDAIQRGLPFDYREKTATAVEEIKKIRLRAINDLLGGGKAFDTDN